MEQSAIPRRCVVETPTAETANARRPPTTCSAPAARCHSEPCASSHATGGAEARRAARDSRAGARRGDGSDVQISRIRLSDKTSRLRPRHVVLSRKRFPRRSLLKLPPKSLHRPRPVWHERSASWSICEGITVARSQKQPAGHAPPANRPGCLFLIAICVLHRRH